jgi:hypothetical protein
MKEGKMANKNAYLKYKNTELMYLVKSEEE